MTKVGATDYRGATAMLRLHHNPQRAVTARSFFKDTTGDVFLGVSTPILRRIARDFCGLSPADTFCLLKSRVHEERLLAIEVLRFQYDRGNPEDQQRIFDFLREEPAIHLELGLRGWQRSVHCGPPSLEARQEADL